MISFTQMLIYTAVSLTFIFYIQMMMASKISRRKYNIFQISSRPLDISMVAILLVYLISQTISLIRGYRDNLTFSLATLLSIFLMLYILRNSSLNNFIIILSLLMISFSEPLTLYVGNDFYPRWDWKKDLILKTGHLEEYMREIISSGLYYLIPVSGIRQIMLALICQPSYMIPFINIFAGYMTYIISLYIFFKRSRFKILAGIISVFILISSPGDNLLTGRLVGSLIFPFMLSTLIYYQSGRISALIVSFIFMIEMIFEHGSPVIGYLLLFLPILLKGWDEDLNLKDVSYRIRNILIILSATATIYWIYTHIINQIYHVGYSFTNSVLSYFLPPEHRVVSPWSYVPRYESERYMIYSYAWAFPIALSTALLLDYLVRIIAYEKMINSMNIGEVSAFLSSIVVGSSFLAYRISEGGQYLIPVGYFLALIASTIVLSKILETKRVELLLVTIILTAIFIYTGISSPSHANLEHPEFESSAQIFRSTRYVEASIISNLLESQIKTYYDYDLPISGGIYKTIRERLSLILQGYDPRVLERDEVIYAIKNERLSNIETIFYVSSIIYRSCFYTLFYVGS